MDNPDHNCMIRKANYFCPPHINPELEIVWVKNGTLKITCDNRPFFLHAGEMTVILPYHLHCFYPEDHTDAAVFMFPSVIYENLGETFGTGTPPICTLEPLDTQYLQKLLTEPVLRGVRAKCLFYLCADLLSGASTVPSFPGTGDDFAPEVLKFIFEHLEEDFDIEDMARQLGWNPRKLSSMFRNFYNMKLTELIGNIRIERAITLLETTEISISQIAMQCGFGSLRNFNRAFLQRVSCTPSAYRQQRKTVQKNR